MELRRRMYGGGEDITTGLYCWYKLLNLNDELGLNNLTLTGTVPQVTGVDLVANSAYSSNAVDGNYLTNISATQYSTTFGNISCWIKTAASQSSIFNLYTTTGFKMSIMSIGGKSAYGYGSLWHKQFPLSPAINDNNWHHISINYDFTNHSASLYVDGNFIQTITDASGTKPTTVSEINIFRFRNSFQSGGIYGFNGAVDNARAYTINLTDKQIKYLYNNKL